MSEQEFYEFLVWSVKAAGVAILLLMVLIGAAHKYTPSFPEDDGESL